MQPHKIVSHDEWLAARKAHLADEKAFTHARDALSRKRRELPWEKVDKNYVFDTPDGKKTLADLFEWQEPADRLSLHARPGLGAGLPELLAARRSLRRRGGPSRAARRRLRRRLARAARPDRKVRAAHGLALQMGVVVRQRLQLRLPRVGDAGGKGVRQGDVQLRAHRVPERGAPRRQRVLQGRRPARSSTPIPATGAGSTSWSAPTTSSTSPPRAVTRKAWNGRWPGSATTTATTARLSIPTRPTNSRRP